MDTSSGLSSIASLSLGFTMSMRAGGMAFAANRGGPLTTGPTNAWTIKPPSSPSAVQPSTASDGTSPRRNSEDQADENGSYRSTTESFRSLVVPSVSLVSAPLASKDRQMDDDSQTQPPLSCRSISPIVEVPEDAESSSTDDEQQLTITTVSNADCSQPIIDISNVVDFQTIPEGPILHPPDDVVTKDETVVQVGETSQSVTAGSRRSSGQSGDVMIGELPLKRTSISHIDRSSVECFDEESVRTDYSLPMPLRDPETNSDRQLRDDVIVDMQNDVNGDVVGNFFTPSIVDLYDEFVSPPCESEPIAGVVRNTESPVRQVLDVSAVVADGAYKRSESVSTDAPLLKNGADSSAGGWLPTARLGLAASPRAENSASAAATSLWRRNPLTRLARHRKDAVGIRQTL